MNVSEVERSSVWADALCDLHRKALATSLFKEEPAGCFQLVPYLGEEYGRFELKESRALLGFKFHAFGGFRLPSFLYAPFLRAGGRDKGLYLYKNRLIDFFGVFSNSSSTSSKALT